MKRRYGSACACETAGGHTVELDGKPLMTPASLPLVVPQASLARAIAEEWNGRADGMVSTAMPMTRLAATAIDRVAPDPERVRDELSAFAGSDLVCFRATYPAELVERQEACWQPLVDRAALRHDAVLTVGTGVMPIAQAPGAIRAFRTAMASVDSFRLAGLQWVTRETGSLVIALALLEGHLSGEDAFRASALDDLWSLEVWGHDEEAWRKLEADRSAILDGERFLGHLPGGKASLAGRHGSG